MRASFFIVLLAMAFSVDIAAANAVPSLTPEQAMEQMATVNTFAFGGIDYGLRMSPGEAAYRVLITRTNALDLFKAVLTNGTEEAKLYALCGIRKLAPKEFDACAAPIIASDKKVTTQSGCIVWPQSPGHSVVRGIKNGNYDADRVIWSPNGTEVYAIQTNAANKVVGRQTNSAPWESLADIVAGHRSDSSLAPYLPAANNDNQPKGKPAK